MRNDRHCKRSLRTSITTVLLASSMPAFGAGFALLEQSTSRLGTAFAGSAVLVDGTTIFFNPAALVSLDRPQALANLGAVEITSEFSDTGSQPALGQPLGGNGGDAGDWNFVPSIYASLPLSENLAVGLGINAPFGLKLEYDNDWIGRYQALNSEITTININPTVAYRFGSAVSIGIGLDYQRLEAELTNAVNFSAVIAQGVQQLVASGQLPLAAVPGVLAANSRLDGHARVRGDDDAWGFNVGALFQLGPNTELGVHYRSSIDYRVSGTAQFSTPTVTSPIGSAIVSAATATGGPLASGPVFVDLEVPDTAVASLSQKVGDALVLLADVAWTGWSSIQELRVVRTSGATLSVTPEHWNDTWRFALGGMYSISPQVMLRAGVAFDETPVPDSTRTPRLPDTDRQWVAIGARWAASDAINVDVAYAHLFGSDVPLDQNAGSTNANGRLFGEQSTNIDIVSVQLNVEF